uniref:Porphobilinogen deaminase n=1 Tax=uncultured bacterium 5G4 TaxID=1701326 RepID=A0A166H3Q3_9BACT|nr:hydroxymethylbilane synthase [uncultured bacterium 5G4]
MTRLVLGTRGSPLARRQVEIVIEALQASVPGIEIETRIIRTEGDRRTDEPLQAMAGEGVFVKEIERLLLSREIDIAVHSLKDMPAVTPEGLTIGAVMARGDARDALVSRDNVTLAELPNRARVGTDSRRRVVQLLALRPDLEVEGIRGNVDTRIGKTESGEYDAVVLAYAGLQRLGLGERPSQVFSLDEILPAVGQAVLAIECRAGDEDTLKTLSTIEDTSTRAAIDAERAFLRRLGTGCSLPIGCYGEVTDDKLRLRAFVANDDGRIKKGSSQGPASAAARSGDMLAVRLMMEAGVAPARRS